MAFEKVEVLEGEEITPEAVVAKVRGMIDEVAWEVFDKHVDMLVDWVRSCLLFFAEYRFQPVNKVELGLNAYNRPPDGGIPMGLQSVAVGFRHDSEHFRRPEELKDLTFGVIASGLVGEDAVYETVKFPVARQNAESITPDDGLTIDRIGLNSNVNSGQPSIKGKKVFVEGPDYVRTIVEVPRSQATQVTPSEPNEGVYICSYQDPTYEYDDLGW